MRFNTLSKLKLILLLLLCLSLLFSGCKAKDENSIIIMTSTGKYSLIEGFSPNKAMSCSAGSVIAVSVTGKYSDLSVTAEFCGNTVQLTKDYPYQNDDVTSSSSPLFVYSGSFTLPSHEKDTALGQIKLTCIRNKETEVYYSGIITVVKSTDSAVGEKYIAEVVSVPAETFDGDKVNDTSLPTNSYLPVGTVDYCSSTPIVNEAAEKSYRLLRYGKRVYDDQNIKVYEGTLPSENTLYLDKCETDNKYTVLSFFTDWKAPFTVQLKGQEFINKETGDFRIKEATYTHLEIRFMYCNQISGEISLDQYNPLFSEGKVTYEENCAILTLTLKKPGEFYGWRADYDQDDCLVFRFLEPTRIYPSDNEYGIALYDKVIIVDAGHGGNDPGSVIEGVKESNTNLSLAFILEKELEAAGATVVLTRRDDTPLNTYERYAKVLEYEPDFLISIHRNGGGSNGFSSYYYNPFSASPASFIYEATRTTVLYQRVTGPHWHYFYLNRLGICPSVLTENGFLDNDSDRVNMKSADHQRACAKAIVKGIAEYFKSQHY